MADNTLSARGPLFGPNFIVVDVNDDTGKLFQLNVYPDANNPLLKANGLPTHYYFMPQRIYLAKKQDFPDDFDFGMTVFKGLMTSEDTIGITSAMTSSGEASTGGGFCTFATTFAIPESVLQKVVENLKSKDYNMPPATQRVAHLFAFDATDPDPQLGIVPIVENNVTIEVPTLQAVGDSKLPYYLNAQGAGKGSIEAQGISSYLVTCNQMAGGAVAGSIEKGVSPFTVHYNLKQQFYINACDIHMEIDVDKVFQQFSSAVSTGGFLGIDSASLSANYQNCITSGAIKTFIKMDNADCPDDLKKMIDQQVEEMRKQAYDMVKKEIFDWTPTPDAPASTDRSGFSSLFGGTSVSLKANYQKRGIHLQQDFELDSSIAVYDTVSGDLTDLEPAVKANKDKYLAIVDIGEYFKKVQVAATNNANWSEKLADGTDLKDPIKSLQVEVGYPDFDNPLDANGDPNAQYRAQGFHYTVGNVNVSAGVELSTWTADNPKDIINVSFLKLDKNIPNWDVDQVKIRKTIVFDGEDPRVELADNGTVFIKEETTKGHAPVITPDEVGYVFVRFMLDRVLPKDNITATLTCKLGGRTDTLTVTRQNQKNIIWEIFSDKYLKQNSFQYQVQVEVVGPNFTDDPVQYQSSPVTVSLPTGRVKYLNPLKVVLPPAPPEKVMTINNYIKNYPSS